MNFAVIVAGGVGSRLESSSIPKQFIEVNNVPIFWHTTEKFLVNKNIDYVVISCHKEWISFVDNIIKNNNMENKVKVCEGGSSRNNSIEKALNYISKNFANYLTNDSVIITHDAVRMFVDYRIIEDNIQKSKMYDVVDTIVPASDTITISLDGKYLHDIPERNNYYLGQTPQSAKWSVINDIYKNQKNSEWFDRCDLCKLAKLNNNKIGVVKGSYSNFKITTDFDLKMAKILVEKSDKL